MGVGVGDDPHPRRAQPGDGVGRGRLDPIDLARHYEEHGSGPPLLLAAGLGGVGSFWAPQIPVLAPSFRVVIHDHRGTGQSSRDRIAYSVAQMARDVLDLADGLGIDRFHFVGHSAGAAIGTRLLLDSPDRLFSAVLCAGWAVRDPHFARCFETRAALLRDSGPEAYVRAQALFLYPPWWISANDAKLTELERASLAHFPPEEIMLSRIAAVTAHDPGSALNGVSTPTLVTVADDDHLTPPHFSLALHRAIPGSDLAILPTGAHFNTATMPHQFNELLLGWLRAQAEGAAWTPPPFARSGTVHHA